MENAIVAVSNGAPSITAKKFYVGLHDFYGRKRAVLADKVFYKDGLVLLEGVIKVVSAEVTPSILRIRHSEGKTDINTCVNLSISWGYPDTIVVNYATKVASLVLNREKVAEIEGLATMEGLDVCWTMSKAEADLLLCTKEKEAIERIKKVNKDSISTIAGLRREDRAFTEWSRLPFVVRLFKPFKKFVAQIPSSPEDEAWVRREAEKYGIDFC